MGQFRAMLVLNRDRRGRPRWNHFCHTSPCPNLGRQISGAELTTICLSRPYRQHRYAPQHRSEPPPVQVSFRQQQPVVSRMLHQSSARLHNRCCRLVSDQFSIPFASASRRHRFPRLYANMLNPSRTSFDRKRWQLSRVILSACLPSLIHCSAVPRLRVCQEEEKNEPRIS